jgi:hypothetical protein
VGTIQEVVMTASERDKIKVESVLSEAFEKIEQLEVTSSSTHWTSIAKADLKYAMSNIHFYWKNFEEGELVP